MAFRWLNQAEIYDLRGDPNPVIQRALAVLADSHKEIAQKQRCIRISYNKSLDLLRLKSEKSIYSK